MIGESGGFGEHFQYYESETKPSRVEAADRLVSENDFEVMVSRELSGTDDFKDFIESKKEFGVDAVLYCNGILDYLKNEVVKGCDIHDFTIISPGRSGLGIEFALRESIREVFGHAPIGIRLPTESELEGADSLTLSRAEGFRKVPIQYRQEGNIFEWDRDRIFTPQLDEIFKKPKEKVLICDTWKAGGRSLRQVLFALKPYDIKDIIFSTAFPSGEKMSMGESLLEPYKDEIGIAKDDSSVEELLIAVNNGVNFDHIARRIMWLAAGITKMPTNRESLLRLKPEARAIQKKIEQIANSCSPEMEPDEVSKMYEEYTRLYKEKEALVDDGEIVPPPLEFVRGPLNIPPEDRMSLRLYLQNLGHLAAEVYKSSTIENK